MNNATALEKNIPAKSALPRREWEKLTTRLHGLCPFV